MRPSHSRGAILFGIGVAVVLVGMTVTSLDFNPEARVAPLLVGVPTSLAAVAMVVRDVWRVRQGDTTVGQTSDQERDRYSGGGDQGDTAVAGVQAQSAQGIESASALSAVLWVIGLVVLIWIFGLLLAALIFVVSFMKFFANERWLTGTLYALGTTAVIYFLFGELLGQTLYPGLLGGFLPF